MLSAVPVWVLIALAIPAVLVGVILPLVYVTVRWSEIQESVTEEDRKKLGLDQPYRTSFIDGMVMVAFLILSFLLSTYRSLDQIFSVGILVILLLLALARSVKYGRMLGCFAEGNPNLRMLIKWHFAGASVSAASLALLTILLL